MKLVNFGKALHFSQFSWLTVYVNVGLRKKWCRRSLNPPSLISGSKIRSYEGEGLCVTQKRDRTLLK